MSKTVNDRPLFKSDKILKKKTQSIFIVLNLLCLYLRVSYFKYNILLGRYLTSFQEAISAWFQDNLFLLGSRTESEGKKI